MVKDTWEKIQSMFAGRQTAYRMVFDRDNKYTRTVLKDLAKFCRAHESTFSADQRVHAAMEGRREVWLRIEEYLNLTVDEIYELHKVKDMMEKK